ncbi:hypothetical protein [Kocuria oceani]|uniref:MmpS family membrane protein n=1 Tax=Kocuria oceani TaxID=988827 RepID=A0ABV9TQA0_9MICC|nr:hypothetical protein [Kocuria oceani]
MTQPPSGPGPQGPDYGQQPGPYQGQPGQYHPGYGQQPPQKKSKKKWFIGCGVLLVLAIIALFAGCAALLATADAPGTLEPQPNNSQSAGGQETENSSEGRQVTLRATATGNAMVTYGGLNGSSSASFTTEWSEEITADPGDFVTMIVSNNDYEDGAAEVTCQIVLDGEVVAEQKGTGTAATASCDGNLPYL